jgi:hypothetical protein
MSCLKHGSPRITCHQIVSQSNEFITIYLLRALQKYLSLHLTFFCRLTVSCPRVHVLLFLLSSSSSLFFFFFFFFFFLCGSNIEEDIRLLSCSPPSIPLLRYLSPINNTQLSYVILYNIFPTSLGSPLALFMV